jgi:hypothetical protein
MMYTTLIQWIIKKGFLNKVLAACGLAVIIFTFFHCEFGLYDFDGDNHGTHDYCEIVKKATVTVHKDLTISIYKLKAARRNPIDEKLAGIHCSNEIIQYIASFAKLEPEPFRTPQMSVKIYLNNRIIQI